MPGLRQLHNFEYTEDAISMQTMGINIPDFRFLSNLGKSIKWVDCPEVGDDQLSSSSNQNRHEEDYHADGELHM